MGRFAHIRPLRDAFMQPGGPRSPFKCRGKPYGRERCVLRRLRRFARSARHQARFGQLDPVADVDHRANTGRLLRWRWPLARRSQEERASKGVLITTSSFSNEAASFAESVTPRVMLVDGKELARLMIEYEGGFTSSRRYEIKRIDLLLRRR